MLRGQPASSAYSRIAVLPSRPSGGRIWDSTEHESKRLPRRALLQAKPTEGNRTRDAGRPQTWHYGLIAKWWSEFNVDFRPHEIPYFQRHIERNGQPALDVACGTGRLLLPYLRAGLDVDGCDVSADMIELCREKATREGLSTTLFVQPMHERPAPPVQGDLHMRCLRAREHPRAGLRGAPALPRVLRADGTLLLDIEVPYADSKQWRFWLREERGALPEAPTPPREQQRASDGAEYALRSRMVELEPLGQRVTLAMRAEQWRDGLLQAEEDHLLNIGLYFRNELLLMLERAEFTKVIVQGDHNDSEATSDDDFLVFVASKQKTDAERLPERERPGLNRVPRRASVRRHVAPVAPWPSLLCCQHRVAHSWPKRQSDDSLNHEERRRAASLTRLSRRRSRVRVPSLPSLRISCAWACVVA
jgi:SAM-dependent methyltransferase